MREMARIGLDPPEGKMRLRFRQPGQRIKLFKALGAAAVHAHLKLDQHRQLRILRRTGRLQGEDILFRIRADRQIGPPGQLRQPAELFRLHDLIRDDHARYAAFDQIFRFTQLGAGDPTGAVRHLPLRDRQALV